MGHGLSCTQAGIILKETIYEDGVTDNNHHGTKKTRIQALIFGFSGVSQCIPRSLPIDFLRSLGRLVLSLLNLRKAKSLLHLKSLLHSSLDRTEVGDLATTARRQQTVDTSRPPLAAPGLSLTNSGDLHTVQTSPRRRRRTRTCFFSTDSTRPHLLFASSPVCSPVNKNPEYASSQFGSEKTERRMAPPSAATTDSGAPSYSNGISENNLLPFFVMKKGSERKSSTSKTRRKIGFSLSHDDAGDSVDEDDATLKQLKSEAFDFVWSKIESSIKDVLRKINKNVFDGLHNWVCQSFQTIRSCGRPGYLQATRPYPIVTDASLKQLYTALVLTKNMEFVDDLLTFEELGHHLRSFGSHVANLSSSDFSANNGIGGCLRSLLRQFLTAVPDVADLSILALWYNEQGDDQPIVIIIEDMERCCGKILSDFILMLSEWVIKLPIILIMGSATTLDAARVILPSDALQVLRPFKFVLGSPAERMDAVVEAVLVKPCSWFTIGHKVALFLKNYFLNQDGTLTAFIRALKIACMLHFSGEPLSFLLKELATEGVTETSIENHVYAKESLLNDALELPSCRRKAEHTVESLVHGLTELEKSQRNWSTVLLCLHEAGKSQKIQLLDLFCEALDPDSTKSRSSNNHLNSKREAELSPSSDRQTLRQYTNHSNSSINKVVCRMRGLQPALLHELLKTWEKYVEDVPEIHEKVKDLCFMLKPGDGRNLRHNSRDTSMRHRSQNPPDVMKETKALSEKACRLIEWVLRYMTPVEFLPFHEICCFKDVDKLQAALLGDPRRRVQSDLLEPSKVLCCSCCTGGSLFTPSSHDTSIMYHLAQEHGDVINLHDWYQSFKAVGSRPATTKRKAPKNSPSSKKRMENPASQNQSAAVTQARFCRAVMELQITGLLRMPSKRRPDHVQRVAFGL